jgi:hypothetical protein
MSEKNRGWGEGGMLQHGNGALRKSNYVVKSVSRYEVTDVKANEKEKQ